VYESTRSAAWIGAATISRLLPYVLLGPVGGAIADRYPRRTVLLAGDALRLGLMLVLAAIIAADGPVAVVVACTALASAAGSAEKPAALALLPRLVGESRLGPANALLHTVQDLGIVVGPALGALLLAVGPAWVAFLANGATFAGSALLIATMCRDKAPARDRGGGARVVGGFRVARRTPFALALFVIVAMVELTYGAQTVQLVVYAARSLGLGDKGYGQLLGATGVGGVLSALVNGRLAWSNRVSVIAVTAALLACATQLAFAATDVVVLALAVAVVGGGGLVSCEVVAETALARIAPRDALGRMIGVFDATSVAAMIAGAVLAPALIAATSLRASLLILGAAAVLVSLLAYAGLRGLDALSAQRAGALASRIELLAGLPVTVGVPRLVLEQLAHAGQLCPLPAGVDVVVQGAPAHAF
jgi:MFS family permease